MGSATKVVPPAVFSMVVTVAIATLVELEGNAFGAYGWCPLSTIQGVIPLLVTGLPPTTAAAGAFGAAAPFSIVMAKP